jgi:hypothetical protein
MLEKSKSKINPRKLFNVNEEILEEKQHNDKIDSIIMDMSNNLKNMSIESNYNIYNLK